MEVIIMRMVDLIVKKRDGKSLTKSEIDFIIEGFDTGIIPDYQMSALSMAILLRSMSEEETINLTQAIINSGEIVDLSQIDGAKVDKHSTGGVGDKTTLILGPMLAAMGMKVAKLSGRGLGHTGGTVDKLEAIPGFNVELDSDKFIEQVNKIGISVIGQTKNLTPADKRLYALRDVTGTVESIPLIASSIMSKKIASGADNILLDVKVGSGAFMKDVEQASKLAETMVNIGNGLKRNTSAMITNMEQPLGHNVGNALEVKEAVDTLCGKGPADLTTLCVEAAVQLAVSSKLFENESEAREAAFHSIDSQAAYKSFLNFIKSQGGDISVFDDLDKFVEAKNYARVTASADGYVESVDALTIGNVSMLLGAGRAVKEDVLDMQAGCVLKAKIGSKVKKGDTLVLLQSSDDISNEAIKRAEDAFVISANKTVEPEIIVSIIK